jgi:hypothetical protein
MYVGQTSQVIWKWTKTDWMLVARISLHTSISYLSSAALGFATEVVVLVSSYKDSTSKVVQRGMFGAFQYGPC